MAKRSSSLASGLGAKPSRVLGKVIADLHQLGEGPLEHFRLYLGYELSVDHIVEVNRLERGIVEVFEARLVQPAETTVDLSGNTRGVVVELHRERSVERSRVDVCGSPARLSPPREGEQ